MEKEFQVESVVGGGEGGREGEWRGEGGGISKGVICNWFGVRVLEEWCLQPG
jgi:hypothetical protein